MINPVVAHCVVECGFLIPFDAAYRNEIVPAIGVKPNAAIRVAGMIEFADETGVESELMLPNLRGMRVIF